MSELSFSKKQLSPIMSKYGINETNPLFTAVVNLFANQTPYQIWALKSILDKKSSFDNICHIHEWSKNNKNCIKLLSKGNIISYTTKTDFMLLRDEMVGIDMMNLCKSCIDMFNTNQRKMLRDNIFGVTPLTPIDAYRSFTIKKWYKIFEKFNRLAKHKIEKLIITSSAIDDFNFLKKHITDAFTATYDWNKEDLISYVELNTPDCKVVFNDGPYVVVEVTSFESSKKLCGNGRTSWCLTRQNDYFNQYVTSKNAHQYFYFDFSKRENCDLSHVGFTVQDGQGITNAHDTKNHSILGDCTLDGINTNVHQILEKAGIPTSVYIKLKELTNFAWNINSFLEFVEKNKREIAVAYSNDNRLVVNFLTDKVKNAALNFTLCDNSFVCNENNKVYAMFDFNLDVNDNNSVIIIQYKKDKYNIDTFKHAKNSFGKTLKSLDYLNTIGITSDLYLNREEIDPSILLHKLIEEKNEEAAIKLIAKGAADINYIFNDNSPVFMCAEFGLFDVFNAIVSQPNFDSSVTDGLGEPLLSSLMYEYDAIPQQRKTVKRMIEAILKSPSYDRNVLNINYDSAINIACSHPSLNWVITELIKDPNVNLNIVNDVNCTSIGEAINSTNLEALKMIGTRPDLVIRQEDEERAKNRGIKLTDFIKPQPMPKMIHTELSEIVDYALDFEEIFKSIPSIN